MYDCIVVGAGPAGAATAYHLAKQGHSVLLVEKQTLPRYKPCSGAVSPSVAEYFDFDFTPAIDRTMRRVRYTYKLGDPIEAELTTADPIWMVKREVFDQFLVQQAQNQGALLKDNTAVSAIENKGDYWRVITAGEVLEAAYLVAADGAQGPMAQWLGFPNLALRSASVLEVPAPVGDDCAINFEFGLVKQGCAWNFPKGESYSIGAATFLGQGATDYRKVLAKYSQSFGVSLSQGAFHSHPLKLWDGNHPLHTHRALLVGEAAAIVDPLSAEGIRPGMVSGVRAAEAIHAALGGSLDALANYTATIHNTWGEDMPWAKRISGLFFRVPGLGYRVGIKRPTATNRLGQILAGEVRYADIASRVMKRLSGGLLSG
ncbi:geranylgeranyl reductase family protein [Nodosilinea sp. LEGE 07088]|uniref:geranylgeranyl reductase family protein n=1 Tax=Nodosilinea sp. LEGE 07088 TaxID=2777968 RepID=UPI001881245B|nr:geranylgeranyl reductase family protein [Nodosilinea sp. LEGE 07088]MBE9140103.1 geranylgeranyl reductase family protein [Nodosilinea sp. LEGE 07088]